MSHKIDTDSLSDSSCESLPIFNREKTSVFFGPNPTHRSKTSICGKIVIFLQSALVQKILMFILAIDVVCVGIEIIIETFATCKITHTNCSNLKIQTRGLKKQLVLQAVSTDIQIFNVSGCIITVKKIISTELLLAVSILEGISLSILFIFALEISLLAIALGFSFWKNPFYSLDFVVVLTSLSLSLLLRGHQVVRNIILVVLFTRIWRIARICHGIAAEVREMGKFKLENAEKKLSNIHKMRNKVVSEMEHEVEKYRTEIKYVTKKLYSPLNETKKIMMAEEGNDTIQISPRHKSTESGYQPTPFNRMKSKSVAWGLDEKNIMIKRYNSRLDSPTSCNKKRKRMADEVKQSCHSSVVTENEHCYNPIDRTESTAWKEEKIIHSTTLKI